MRVVPSEKGGCIVWQIPIKVWENSFVQNISLGTDLSFWTPSVRYSTARVRLSALSSMQSIISGPSFPAHIWGISFPFKSWTGAIWRTFRNPSPVSLSRGHIVIAGADKSFANSSDEVVTTFLSWNLWNYFYGDIEFSLKPKPTKYSARNSIWRDGNKM